MGIGKPLARVDARDKVTGEARFTADLCPANALVVRLVHSTVANGLVTSIDTAEAEQVPGVVRIVTCFDVPDRPFPTAGHPWSIEPAHQDIADRYLLAKRVLIYGDDIAAVVARDTVAADRAVRLIKVKYEEYPPLMSVEQAMAEGAPLLHEGRPGNLLAGNRIHVGESFEAACAGEDCEVYEGHYRTQTVQHCHIEPPVSFAYMEHGQIVVVSSTQIPHIVRRITAQAMGLPVSKIRIVKPYIGGGFGNKQDALYEPLCAYLTSILGGRPVKLELTREETFSGTRVRHAISCDMRAAVTRDGRIIARELQAFSDNGAYASHGHSICANTLAGFYNMYPTNEKYFDGNATTVYTNRSTAGAMRAYGIPQGCFALESFIDDICYKSGLDPIDIRVKNMTRPGFKSPGTDIPCITTGLEECIEKGRQLIGWDEKRKAYANQSGDIRRGVGMAIFNYKTGVFPISLETASARMVLNQDGTVRLFMGATEIGQGAATAFTQMAAESTGIREEDILFQQMQDTDNMPFDLGAYGSRQSYVSGKAVKKCGESLKKKILAYAAVSLGCTAEELDIADSKIVNPFRGTVLRELPSLAEEAFYSLDHAEHITAEESIDCKENTLAFGCCFAEVEVDIPLGKIKILNIVDVLDSGKIINPATAEAQVHGGMSMSLGYGLAEQLKYDGATGRCLNGNFLDYKLPTALDTPDLVARFVETEDPSAPYGNKALGENPAIPSAPAVRNAVLWATGVGFDELPLNPERLVKGFTDAGLIRAL